MKSLWVLNFIKFFIAFQLFNEMWFFFNQSAPTLPTDTYIAQFVSSVATQGDVWLFAECKDNHWAINGHQKGTISRVLTCDTFLVCDESLEEENTEEINTLGI